MKYIYIPPRAFGSNSYIVYNGQTLEGFVIDPGISGEKALKTAKENNIKLVAQLFTHGHFDHVWDAKKLQKIGIPVYMREDNLALAYGPRFEPFTPDKILSEGKINLCGIEIEVIATPGHSDGSCCFVIENLLFSGDTLFSDGGIGRYDLPSGSFEKLTISLKKLLPFKDGYLLLPGHGL